MTQPYIQADGVRIEPGSGQTLTIGRDSGTGALRFVDAVITGGINLPEMAGLSTIAGVLIVGASGAGAGHTTIQSALNAVPVSASLTNPYVVLVMPGVYAENLVIEKAGITVMGIGRVVIAASAATPTITVQSSVSTTPTSLILKDLVISQSYAGQACLSLVGAAGTTLGRDGVVLDGCTLTATGLGSFTVLANTMNTLVLRDCRSDGSSATASVRVSQCASLKLIGGEHPDVQADYNAAGTLPVGVGSYYDITGCDAGDIQSTLTGGGELRVDQSTTGNITVYGDRTLSVSNASVGDLSINGTTAATVTFSARGTLTGHGTLTRTVET